MCGRTEVIMWKIGLSLNKNSLCEKTFIEMQECGIGAVEVSMEAYEYPDADFKTIFSLADKYGIECWSLHLPIAPQQHFDVSNREATVEAMAYQTKLIKRAASEMGIKHFVIHSGGEPLQECDRGWRIQLAGEKLSLLADVAEAGGADLAVEDLPRTCLGRDSDEVLAILSYDDRLKACFDANHLFRESEVDYIKKLGKRIVTTHISDRDNINERHWLPGEGLLDWVSIVDALEDVGYNGVWLYEIDFDIPKNILRDRPLCPADFAKNAQEVFARKKPTVFSRPKPNLGMWE